MDRRPLDQALWLVLALSACAASEPGRVKDGGGGTAGSDLARGDGGGSPFDRDAACARVSAQATLVKRPVDVIFVIDNSGSMVDEIIAVENNINQNFAAIVGASGLDYRVILISQHGSAKGSNSICIRQPLGGNPTCDPPPQRPTNTARFYHFSTPIGSTSSLGKLLAYYHKPDEFNLAPDGWSAWLRPDALKTFVELTDDGSATSTADFDGRLLALMPKMFGDAQHRDYVFHTIAGLKENDPATSPWLPGDPLQSERCTNGGGAVSNGMEYQRLSALTGGLRFPICEHASFDAVFQAIAAGVIQGSQVACHFGLPTPPEGQTLDLATVIVEYLPSGGGSKMAFAPVRDPAQCGPGKFYIAMGEIVLCPDACATVKADPAAKITVLFDCAGPPPS